MRRLSLLCAFNPASICAPANHAYRPWSAFYCRKAEDESEFLQRLALVKAEGREKQAAAAASGAAAATTAAGPQRAVFDAAPQVRVGVMMGGCR
jgi:hypothetical protein